MPDVDSWNLVAIDESVWPYRELKLTYWMALLIKLDKLLATVITSSSSKFAVVIGLFDASEAELAAYERDFWRSIPDHDWLGLMVWPYIPVLSIIRDSQNYNWFKMK